MPSGIHHFSTQEGLNLELGQGGYIHSTESVIAAYADDTYVAVTALVAASGGESALIIKDLETGEQFNIKIPVGETIHGRWSVVAVLANNEVIIYKGN